MLTYVGPHDDKQVAAALRREMLRDGQVFYIHNRVRSIDQTAARVSALVPEARVAVAHGQMPEEQLERTVEGFSNRRVRHPGVHDDRRDGLDILNANTLIVERADTFFERTWSAGSSRRIPSRVIPSICACSLPRSPCPWLKSPFARSTSLWNASITPVGRGRRSTGA